MMLGFLVGLGLGTGLWMWERRRSTDRLKRLLTRMESMPALSSLGSALGYDAQLAGAINEQQEQIESLTQQLKAFRQLVEQAPVGYLQVDDENLLLWFNERAQEYLGIEKLAPSESPRLLLAVVRSYELDQLIEKTRETQKICEARWTFNSISTDPVNYRERPAYPLQGFGIPLEFGQVGVYLCNQQEAVTLAQQRDRWISDVAHELKTPLTSIRLVAETLQSRVDPGLLNWVDRLLKESIRLGNLVDSVLAMSRLEQGHRLEAQESVVDIVAMVKAAWQGVEPLARVKQLMLDYQGPGRVMSTLDAGLMHSVFVNLLSNAVKYSPLKQAVVVKISLIDKEAAAALAVPTVGDVQPGRPAQILIEVIDSGHGLADRDLPHVFERFYRGDPARSRETQFDAMTESSQAASKIAEISSSGTGLGLAIVRQIVTAHQGWVDVRNNPDTGGGWFRVGLPGKRWVDDAEAVVLSAEKTDGDRL